MTATLFPAYALARMSASHSDALMGPAATYPGAFARLIGLVAATLVMFALVRVAPRGRFLRERRERPGHRVILQQPFARLTTLPGQLPPQHIAVIRVDRPGLHPLPRLQRSGDRARLA